jgi:hypothetical protein
MILVLRRLRLHRRLSSVEQLDLNPYPTVTTVGLGPFLLRASIFLVTKSIELQRVGTMPVEISM